MSFQQAQLSGLIPDASIYTVDGRGDTALITAAIIELNSTNGTTINAAQNITLGSATGIYTSGTQADMDKSYTASIDLSGAVLPYFASYVFTNGIDVLPYNINLPPPTPNTRIIITNNTTDDLTVNVVGGVLFVIPTLLNAFVISNGVQYIYFRIPV